MKQYRYYIVLPDGTFCRPKDVTFYALPEDSEEVREIEESGKFPRIAKGEDRFVQFLQLSDHSEVKRLEVTKLDIVGE